MILVRAELLKAQKRPVTVDTMARRIVKVTKD